MMMIIAKMRMIFSKMKMKIIITMMMMIISMMIMFTIMMMKMKKTVVPPPAMTRLVRSSLQSPPHNKTISGAVHCQPQRGSLSKSTNEQTRIVTESARLIQQDTAVVFAVLRSLGKTKLQR